MKETGSWYLTAIRPPHLQPPLNLNICWGLGFWAFEVVFRLGWECLRPQPNLFCDAILRYNWGNVVGVKVEVGWSCCNKNSIGCRVIKSSSVKSTYNVYIYICTRSNLKRRLKTSAVDEIDGHQSVSRKPDPRYSAVSFNIFLPIIIPVIKVQPPEICLFPITFFPLSSKGPSPILQTVQSNDSETPLYNLQLMNPYESAYWSASEEK